MKKVHGHHVNKCRMQNSNSTTSIGYSWDGTRVQVLCSRPQTAGNVTCVQTNLNSNGKFKSETATGTRAASQDGPRWLCVVDDSEDEMGPLPPSGLVISKKRRLSRVHGTVHCTPYSSWLLF